MAYQWAPAGGGYNPKKKDGLFSVGPAVQGSLSDALDRIESLNSRLVTGGMSGRGGKQPEWSSGRVWARVCFCSSFMVLMAIAVLVVTDIKTVMSIMNDAANLAGSDSFNVNDLLGYEPVLPVSEFDTKPSALDANFGTQLVNAATAGANPYAATGQENIAANMKEDRAADTLSVSSDGADAGGTAGAPASRSDTIDMGVDALNGFTVRPLAREEGWWREIAANIGAHLRNEGPKVKTLFLGEDTFETWTAKEQGHACGTNVCMEARTAWERDYPPAQGNVVAAINGDKAENAIWRIYQEGIAGINPYVVVIYVGQNDIAAGKDAGEVAAGVQAVLKALHFFLPNTEFLLMGLLPRADDVYASTKPALPADTIIQRDRKGRAITPEQSTVASISFSESKYFPKIRQTNDWLQIIANQANSVHFLDCSLQFLVPGPTSEIELSSNLMYDYLHLTAKGHEKLLSCMRDTVSHLIIGAMSKGGFSSEPSPAEIAAEKAAKKRAAAEAAAKAKAQEEREEREKKDKKHHGKKHHGRKHK